MQGAPRKRGCDSFERCLISLTRSPIKKWKVEKKPQAQAEAAISSREDEDEVALLKDEALAMSEIEAASDLWKKLEHLKPGDEQNIFTADELNTLWRVAIAKARTRITHDTQLPFHCLDLAKQQLVSRSNDALVRLLCVIHSAQAAGHQKEIRDFIRAFIRSLVRELLDQVFTEQAQQVMRSHAFQNPVANHFQSLYDQR